ncbi:mechanosensitive ion channel family protein [Glaciecola sp. 2405UD65-10]|jgi:small-conductance mechanosensitive channel|uniref:mechanosensitive ion channel family protein n=1 Tax=Glaciecola sp. 2405UD65-10 TaxID=3397244 RepID=UPI003B5CCD79
MQAELLNHPVLLSVVIIVCAYLLKLLIGKIGRRRRVKKATDNKHLTHSLRHFINLLMVMMLLVVWSTEIQNFALSVAAFAVAIVLAMREFIQSIIGFFYLVTTRPFKVGDWIQVDGMHGEVSEIDWVKTTLLDIDLKTYRMSRRVTYIPNGRLVVNPIKNLNFVKRYVTHDFEIVRRESINGFPIYDELYKRCLQYCEEFYDVAVRYNAIIERKLDASIFGPEPEIRFSTTDIGDFKANIKLFCPTELAIELEHKITSDFMQLWDEELDKKQLKYNDYKS